MSLILINNHWSRCSHGVFENDAWSRSVIFEQKKAPKTSSECLIQNNLCFVVGGTGFEPVTPAV